MIGNSEEVSLLLEKKQKEVAKKLNLDINEPKQEKRIEALRNLYKKYLGKTTTLGYIYSQIIESCNSLIEIYERQDKEVKELRNSLKSNFFSRTKLENINFKNKEIISRIEEEIIFNKKLLLAYENKYINSLSISDEFRQKLKDIEDESWDNWLKLLDINRELRNNIIGYENRKAMVSLAKSYIDYYIFVEGCVKNCFNKLKDLKKEGVIEYYNTLANFDLPNNKLEDFQTFLQKKIESKLDDAVQIKASFGKSLENIHHQIDEGVDKVHRQFLQNKKELISIINYYKNFLLQKQVLFTHEAENLVSYLKKRYLEKIDIFCSSFNKYNTELKAKESKLSKKDLNLLKKFFQEEFDLHINKLKIKYSEKFIPLLDSFWHTEKMAEKEYAFDRNLFNQYSSELKNLKIKSVKSLISKFEKEREKINSLLEDKNNLLEDPEKLNVEKFNQILSNIKKDCEDICSEIISSNYRFWTRANAEFNCEVRRYLIKLNYQYSPWTNYWREGTKSWMGEYLTLNLNSEALKMVGISLKNFSPESDLYINAGEALFKYNENSRKIFKRRDDIEFKHLLEINTIPEEDVDALFKLSNEKIIELEKKYKTYWENYNDFYNYLLSN